MKAACQSATDGAAFFISGGENPQAHEGAQAPEARVSGTMRLVERFGDTVMVQVPFTMKALREILKVGGAKWDPVQKLRRVQRGLIRGDRQLVERVVKG